MKRKYKVLFVALTLCIAWIWFTSFNIEESVSSNENEQHKKSETKKKTSSELFEKQKSLPIKITIDGIEAPITPVGLAEDGAMDTVDDAKTIAWYQYGSVPGEKGNALLAGHDSWRGEQGTFKNLEHLKPGTKITIEFSNGVQRILSLEKTEVYDKDNVPSEIMNIAGEERTTLITCTGKFNREEGTSENRVISIFKYKKESEKNVQKREG